MIPPFNPAVPSQPPEVRRFATAVVDFANRLNRNEFTERVSLAPAGPYAAWSPQPAYTARTVGWSPVYNGMVLRRARIVTAASKRKTASTIPGAAIRALVLVGDVESEVGTFSTFDFTLSQGAARLMSRSDDLGKPLPIGCVLAAEITYTNYPPIDFTDSAILFDIGVI